MTTADAGRGPAAPAHTSASASIPVDPAPEAVPVNGAGQATPGQLRADESTIREALSEVYDPEIGIDIVSLGLVYGHNLGDDGHLQVDMTLTSPYCPLGDVLTNQVSAVCAPLPGVESVSVNFVFSPPWDPRTMASEEAKLDLGIY